MHSNVSSLAIDLLRYFILMDIKAAINGVGRHQWDISILQATREVFLLV